MLNIFLLKMAKSSDMTPDLSSKLLQNINKKVVVLQFFGKFKDECKFDSRDRVGIDMASRSNSEKKPS